MILVYVAGPYRGTNAWIIEENIRRAERVALESWRCGAAVICPHANTRFYQGALPDQVWLDGDLEMIMRSDVVMMVEGWEHSVGACEERRTALEMGIPVVYTLEELACLITTSNLDSTTKPTMERSETRP